MSTNASLTRSDNVIHVRRISLLKYRDFRNLLLAQIISQCGDAMGTVLLAGLLLFGAAEGPSVTRLTCLVATTALPLVVAGPLAGIIADRFTRRRILVIGQGFRAALCGAMLVMIATNHTEFVFLAWGANMCVARILYTSRIASFRHLVRNHELVAADSLSLTSAAVSGAVGSSIGLVLATQTRAGGLGVVVVAHLLSAVMFGLITTNIGGGRDHQSAGWHDTVSRLKDRKIRYAILATSTHKLFFGALFGAVTLVDSTGMNRSAAAYTGAIGACGIGSFLGANTAEWVNEHFPRRSMTYLVFAASAVTAGITILTSRPFVHLATLLVVAFLFQNLRVCSDATVQSNAISGSGGRAFAVYDISYNLSFLVGILAGLHLFDVIGGQSIFAIAAVGFGILSGSFIVLPRENDLVVDASPVEKLEHPIGSPTLTL